MSALHQCCDKVGLWGKGNKPWTPITKHRYTLIQIWISNYMHYKMWNEIIYPFPNLNRQYWVALSSMHRSEHSTAPFSKRLTNRQMNAFGPEIWGNNCRIIFFKIIKNYILDIGTCYEIALKWMPRNLTIKSQRWVMALCRQVTNITQASVNPALCRHMALLGNNELTNTWSFIFRYSI